MARKQIANPLEGAAPTLSPTARALSIPIGATPAPSRSPLMELGEAFASFNPELRAALRDSAAKADQDAMALGELEAQKSNAAQRMAELDTTIKDAVDKGQLPAARSPAFERGFRTRVGRDLAQSVFQQKLTTKLRDTMQVEGRLDPEQVIKETYAEVSSQIHPEDFYARVGFEDAAKGSIAAFRQRSAEGYAAEYEKAAQQRIADEGTELAFQLATAAVDEVDGVKASIKLHLDEVRKELPKSQVNEFFTKNVVVPAVQRLISERKYDQARTLMTEMDNLDITGKGGLLSQTGVAKSVFANLRASVEEKSRAADNEDWVNAQRAREQSTQDGSLAAAQNLTQMRLANDGKLDPEMRWKLIDSYRQNNSDDPLRVEAFAHAINRDYEGDTKQRIDDKAVAELKATVKSYNKADIEMGRASLQVMWDNGTISPEDFVHLTQTLNQLDALYGAVDEQDYSSFKRNLYPMQGSGRVRTQGVDFGDSDAPKGQGSLDLWYTLSGTLQADHETKVTEFFKQNLEAELRNLGDPNRVKAEKAQILDRVTTKAREYARGLLKEQVRIQKDDDTKKRVAAQTVAQRVADTQSKVRARATTLPPSPPVTSFDLRDKTVLQDNIPQVIQKDREQVSAERDFASVPFKANGWMQYFSSLQDWRIVSLPELAKGASEGRGTDKEVYGYAKSLLGFTPEEIKTGKTKHGVVFEPAQIDPHRIPVFRDRAELEKHWANGQPDETFQAVGDRIDTKDNLSLADFYLAQLALLRR
jgi:hypothetical protein